MSEESLERIKNYLGDVIPSTSIDLMPSEQELIDLLIKLYNEVNEKI